MSWLDDDEFEGIWIAQPSAAQCRTCAYAAQCKVRVPPQGSTEPGECELLADCGLRQLLDAGEAEPKTDPAPPPAPVPAALRHQGKPQSFTDADWDALKKKARADAHRARTARMAAAGASRYAIQWGGTLAEWEASRPNYAKVAEAVAELCDSAPRQWGRAIRGLVKLPRTAGAINAWNLTDAPFAAMEAVAAFDEKHGDALRWMLTDEDIRQRAGELAVRVQDGVNRIFSMHDVDERRAADARQRLAACDEFERGTAGLSAAQLVRRTGRDKHLWARAAALSEDMKDRYTQLVQRMGAALREAVDYIVQKCQLHAVEPPKLRKSGARPDELMAAVKRACDAKWWRRVLRRAAARIVEAGAIKLGMVQRRTGGYCSNDAVQRHAQQQARNAAALAATLMRNEAGQIFTLKELSAASVSNPVNRGGELMTRIRGCEEYADAQGHVGLFITLTTPSAMHPMLAREWADKGMAAAEAEDLDRRTAQVYKAVRNPRYDGATTPRDAQAWLVKQFQKARAAMQRAGLAPYGFRVAEPHHDGTPHWHMLLWLPTEADADRLQELLLKYWVDNDERYKNEKGAAKNRTNFKRLTAGGAAGYIAKYIAKSIGHHALKDHLDEGETGELCTVEMGGVPGHQRVQAWANQWGIRQFQPIGQPSVTVWRELRRVTPDQIEITSWWTDPQAKLAWDACQKIGDKKADWAGYLRAQGGTCLPRADYALQLACRSRAPLTKYGERARRGKVVGVCTRSGRWLISRRLMWVQVHGSEGREEAEAKARVQRGELPMDEAVRAAKAAPWTRFNNCTARLTHGRPNWLDEPDEPAKQAAIAHENAEKWRVIGTYLHRRHTEQLQLLGATPEELAHIDRFTPQQLLQRMRLTVPEALAGMERDGFTRNGVATELALA